MRRWSLLQPEVIEYRPNETENLVTDINLQREFQLHSMRLVAKLADVSRETMSAAKLGNRIRRSTAQKLIRVIAVLPRKRFSEVTANRKQKKPRY
jgi:hypothetical protein